MPWVPDRTDPLSAKIYVCHVLKDGRVEGKKDGETQGGARRQGGRHGGREVGNKQTKNKAKKEVHVILIMLTYQYLLYSTDKENSSHSFVSIIYAPSSIASNRTVWPARLL